MNDSKGLLTTSRTDLVDHKGDFAVEPDRLTGWGGGPPDLLDTVRNVRPTVLIGVAGVARLFSKELVREMTDHTDRPIILALSNPTTLTEVTPSDALEWSEGRAIIATGSPFAPVERGGRVHRIGQGNNMFVFPGVGLGAVAVSARRVSDGMFLAAANALADQVPDALMEVGCIFPDIADVRTVARAVATAVAEQAIAEGLAEPVDDLEGSIDALTWSPEYVPYQPV